MPFCSIVIPSYNNADYLGECLNSVVAQTLGSWEAIVVVDGSPDNSEAVARSYAKSDSRIRVLVKEENEGTHRARMSGVEAALGDYLLFLDADDGLTADALERLYGAVDACPGFDVMHFGMTVKNEGVTEAMSRGVLESCNREFPPLHGDAIARSSFIFGDDPTQDWRILQRLYRTPMVKEAFAQMTRERLGRGQDSYEWLVIASLAQTELFRNDLLLYRYYFGRGITNVETMSQGKLKILAESYAALLEAAREWARACSSRSVKECAEGLSDRICELLAEDLMTRVPRNQRCSATLDAAQALGGVRIAAELMRLARDDAYDHWVNGDSFDSAARYLELFRSAEEIAQGEELSARYLGFRDAAQAHINDLRERSGRTTGWGLVRRGRELVRMLLRRR